MDQEAIKRAVSEILLAIGEDLSRPDIEGTPARVAELYSELFSGIGKDPADEIDVFFETDYDELIMVRDIPLYSICEHHLLPWMGRAHVGYIPNKKGQITGLSKLARVVDVAARRPQVQERLTMQVADALESRLDPRGVLVVIEAEHLCYDRETEILTIEGWLPFELLRRGMPVAQVDPDTLEMSWAQPIRIVRHSYTGPMIHWRSDTVDLKVTPDHRVVYKKEWAFEHKPDEGWAVAPASSLAGRFYVPQAAIWIGGEVASVSLGGVKIAGGDYARFMGAWIAEGCTRESKRDVVISQDDGSFSDQIWELLERLPYGFRRVPQRNRPRHIQFKSSNSALFEDLKTYGKSGDKTVPPVIKAMSREQIGIFLDWYERGDGHRYLRNPLRVQFVSKSYELIDDVQELLIRTGRTGTVQRYPHSSRIETRTHKRASGKGYKYYSKLQPYHRRVVDYVGEVFCVTVPTGGVLVRRNGKPIVSGNCMTMRGVQKPGAITVTSAVRGIIRENVATREEAMRLLRGS